MYFENPNYLKINTYNSIIIVEKDIEHFIFKKIKIIKKNGLFITGIHHDITLDMWKEKEFLGQYGKILKINKCSNKNIHRKYYSIFIEFADKLSGIWAIKAINKLKFKNKKLNASYSTIKPCKYFIINKDCKIKNCFFFHGKIKKYNSIFKVNNFSNTKIIELFNVFLQKDWGKNIYKLDKFIMKNDVKTVFPSVNNIINDIKNKSNN